MADTEIFGLETLHPMVSVIDLSKATHWQEHFRVSYGVYALYLKETKCWGQEILEAV